MPPLPEAKAWLDTFGGRDAMGCLERDGQSISALCHRARQLLTRINNRDAPADIELLQLVSEMQQLDNEATMWRQTPEWSFSTMPKSAADLQLSQELYDVMPETLQLHRDVWMAYEWNYHRAARMILHGQLLQCVDEAAAAVAGIAVAEQLRMQRHVSVAIVQRLADEVLATVPQAFGDVDAQGRPVDRRSSGGGGRAVGAYLLLWPIKIIKGAEAATSEAQKRAGSVVFERIRDCTGMKRNLGELSSI